MAESSALALHFNVGESLAGGRLVGRTCAMKENVGSAVGQIVSTFRKYGVIYAVIQGRC